MLILSPSAERSIAAATHRRAIRRSVHHAAMAKRQLVSSGALWEPLVGYSRAVRVGQWVAVAGTTAAAEGGGAVGGDDIGEQTREALKRIKAALEQAGALLEDVVRTRMFVTDISRWEEVGRSELDRVRNAARTPLRTGQVHNRVQRLCASRHPVMPMSAPSIQCMNMR